MELFIDKTIHTNIRIAPNGTVNKQSQPRDARALLPSFRLWSNVPANMKIKTGESARNAIVIIPKGILRKSKGFRMNMNLT